MVRKPLTGYPSPRYPLRDDTIAADAVARALPDRWRRNGKVAGAMALLFFAPPGAVAPARADAAPPRTSGGTAHAASTTDDKRREPGKPPRVAAVFEHGEGRGAFGCVAVAPPAFLTEADARQVILEEFARVGVRFELDAHPLDGVRERVVTSAVRRKPDGTYDRVRDEHAGPPLVLDGWDPVHRIGFEYISEADYFKLGGERSSSTVQSYDFRDVARRLEQETARAAGEGRVGVFYDPMARVEWERDAHGDYHEPENVRGRAQLRAQVRDFIAWLRANRVL